MAAFDSIGSVLSPVLVVTGPARLLIYVGLSAAVAMPAAYDLGSRLGPSRGRRGLRARQHDAAGLAKRFGEPMSRVLALIGMDWRMDGGTWEQARDRVRAPVLGRQAAGVRRRAGLP